MPSINFGTRADAQEMRDRLGPFLASSDDARKSTIELKSSAPDSLVERAEREAFESERDDREGAGMTELSPGERQRLGRTHDTWSWQKHGFEAMRAKATAKQKGATEWMDFYEPGEGADGVLKNMQSSKSKSARTGASIGVGGDYTDEEEMDVRGRVRRQSERMSDDQIKGAKAPAFGGDADAIGFLREEELFSDSLFDVSLRSDDGPTGRDYERLQDAHADRSKRARTMDERRSARVTRDPLEWAANKSTLDYPGIDTVDPESIHAKRSKRARTHDERERAPIADTREQWVRNPDRYDWEGVDTPPAGVAFQTGSTLDGDAVGDDGVDWAGTGADPLDFGYDADAGGEWFGSNPDEEFGLLDDADDGAASPWTDDRDRQGSLAGFGMETDGSTYRESRTAVERASEFGVDDRDNVARGLDDGVDAGTQDTLFGDDDDERPESGGWF